MAKVAIVYHSGYGHTAVVAESVAEGVRRAGADAVLLKIEGLTQDFGPIIDAVTRLGRGDLRAPPPTWATSPPPSKPSPTPRRRSFTSAGLGRQAGRRLHQFTQLLGRQAARPAKSLHSRRPAWDELDQISASRLPGVTAAERGPETINRVASFIGLMTQSDNAGPDVTPPSGDRETARLLGRAGGQGGDPLGSAAPNRPSLRRCWRRPNSASARRRVITS